MQTGQFFWYDVMTTDVPAAAKFYSAVIGWGTQAANDGYTLFTLDGRGVAGLMAIPDQAQGMPPCWMGYIWADDVDAAAEKLEQAGGKIHRPPTTIEGIIRFAVVSDNQGAGFLLAKGLPREAPPPPLDGRTIGTVGWRELMANDGTAAFAFYENLFGWTKAEAFDMGPMGSYQLFATGAEPVGGMMTRPPHVPVPNWGYYFNVEAIEAAGKRVTAAGGKIINGPMEVPGPMWTLQCLDPMGAYFAMVAAKR